MGDDEWKIEIYAGDYKKLGVELILENLDPKPLKKGL
jgi:hypothetical protein